MEPLFTLQAAAELIPFPSVDALRGYLSKHPDAADKRYRRVRRGYVRLLSEAECQRIRDAVVRPSPKRPTRTV